MPTNITRKFSHFLAGDVIEWIYKSRLECSSVNIPNIPRLYHFPAGDAGGFLQHPGRHIDRKTFLFFFFFSFHFFAPGEGTSWETDFRSVPMRFSCSRILHCRCDWMANPRLSRSTDAPYTSQVIPCSSQTTFCTGPESFLSCSGSPARSGFSAVSLVVLFPGAGSAWNRSDPVWFHSNPGFCLSLPVPGLCLWVR